MSKKLLIREVFERGKKESGRNSKNGIAIYLWSYFEDQMKFTISDKTLVRYNDAFLRDDRDVNIEPFILDKLSQYLDFKDFNDFCKSESFTKINKDSSRTSVNIRIDDEDDSEKKHPSITVNITTNPILKLQEFLTKHSSMGIFGVVLCGSLVVGNKIFKADENIVKKDIIQQDSLSQLPVANNESAIAQTVVYVPQSLVSIPLVKEENSKSILKQCMYWSGKEYIPADCNDTRNGLIAIDMKMVDNFKKITTPDTISSIKNVWYSKHQNVVEFFTDDGVNPDTGKDLRPVTTHIFEKYLN